MLNKFIETCRTENLLPVRKLIVAVSGGADSLALADLLNRSRRAFKLELCIAHYEHGLRGQDSLDDAKFVREFAAALGVEFYCESGDVENFSVANKISVETAARILRYEFLAKVRKSLDFDAIVLAHHSNDQAETVLMRLLRGSAVNGLSAMKFLTDSPYGLLIRPLLRFKKSELENYCAKRGIIPRIDATNFEDVATRNKIRLELLPALEKFNPAIVDTLCRFAETSAAESDFINSEVDKVFPSVVKNSKILRDEFLKLHTALQREVVRKFIDQTTGNLKDFGFVHFENVRKVLANNLAGVQLPNNFRAVLIRGKLSISKNGGVKMETRKLRNLTVSAIGMGCMGFTHGYGALPPESEAIRLIRSAYENYGCTLFDTAEGYGPYLNEELVGKAVKPFRKNIILSTKFTPEIFFAGQEIPEGKTSRRGIRNALDASLKRLQTDYIDIYYEHRVPAERDVAEVAEVMGELIKEGKIRGWGVSECTEAQVRRANSVTPLTAVQSEYSLMERKYEKDVIPACKELGIGFVAFSPMASGFLSGKYSSKDEFKGDDVRRAITRFHKENMDANQPLLDLLHKIAANKNATPAQISLAWMIRKNDFVVPIPGMRRDERLKENFGAANLQLSPAEIADIESELAKIKIYGDRKDSDILKLGTVQTVPKD